MSLTELSRWNRANLRARLAYYAQRAREDRVCACGVPAVNSRSECSRCLRRRFRRRYAR